MGPPSWSDGPRPAVGSSLKLPFIYLRLWQRYFACIYFQPGFTHRMVLLQWPLGWQVLSFGRSSTIPIRRPISLCERSPWSSIQTSRSPQSVSRAWWGNLCDQKTILGNKQGPSDGLVPIQGATGEGFLGLTSPEGLVRYFFFSLVIPFYIIGYTPSAYIYLTV